MKIKGLKEQYAHVAVFKTDVVVLTGDRRLVRKWCEKNIKPSLVTDFLKGFDEHPDQESTSGTMYAVGTGGGVLIHLRKHDDIVLVHELTHAVHHIMLAKHMPCTADNTETMAYMMEYLYTQFLE